MRNTTRRIVIVIAAIALCVLLAATAYALGYLFVEVRDNYFHTGTIDVEIAFAPGVDGSVDLFDPGVLYEPGMTVRGDFIVTNRSTDEEGIWYRIYFSHLGGSLADVMEAKIYDGNTLLWAGKVAQWTTAAFMEDAQALAFGASRQLTLELYYPQQAGNDTQAGTMEFALAVTATQRTANPQGLFE